MVYPQMNGLTCG